MVYVCHIYRFQSGRTVEEHRPGTGPLKTTEVRREISRGRYLPVDLYQYGEGLGRRAGRGCPQGVAIWPPAADKAFHWTPSSRQPMVFAGEAMVDSFVSRQ